MEGSLAIRDVVHMGKTLRSCANMHHEEPLKPIRDNIRVLLGAKARITKSANMGCRHEYLRTAIFFLLWRLLLSAIWSWVAYLMFTGVSKGRAASILSSMFLRNVGKHLPDYTRQIPEQSSLQSYWSGNTEPHNILWQMSRYSRYGHCYATAGYGFQRFLRNGFSECTRQSRPFLGNG
jgi:hypothetical protein